jgi:YVTN family beta-propeller protein
MAPVQGNETQPGGNPVGEYKAYDGNTDGITGLYTNSWDPIVNAYWSHEISLSTFCQTPPNAYVLSYQQNLTVFEQDNVWMANGSTFPWICNTTQLPSTGPAMSRFSYVGHIPSSITLPEIDQADSFSTKYGPPILNVYSGTNGTPTLFTTVTASFVSPSGDSATFPLPNSMPSNAYMFVTANEGSNGTYSSNAYNAYIVASSQTIAGNPFGVSAAAQSITTLSCSMITPPYPGVSPYKTCQSSSSNTAFPVVSLYSLNQVLAGSVRINVGANPTAVIAYGNGTINNTSWDGMTTQTITGTSRAIVANSGSNTISVLDLVNNDLLFNVPVGNQPVAMAISSDSSTAYVANYTDSTVTQVNLNSETATATIAVGGKPTSVALTAAGALWVGGVGFLTELNTNPMSIVATEQIPGKTISALGFSNSEKQLVATTIDMKGNVYSDVVAPSSVQAGATYAPLASSLISSIGTHLVHSTAVQAFTATLAGASKINPNQAGTPPLVVYDAWVAVTATPTGFTITDIADNYVFDSVLTPSPVTAIAVDTNLNSAYLVMPDSNTLLTVPLPGVN